MIAFITGEVIKVEDRAIVVLAGGIGYRLAASNLLLANAFVGEPISVWTYLAVREDALDLYGFINQEEQELFELLLKVSGVGPKSAMNILSNTGVELLRRSIQSNDASYLTKVSGVGKKTAEKIVLELHDKIPHRESDGGASSSEREALDALESLGYAIRDTRDIVRMIAKEEQDTRIIIRLALQQLGK